MGRKRIFLVLLLGLVFMVLTGLGGLWWSLPKFKAEIWDYL